jgi:hypothetical protein
VDEANVFIAKYKSALKGHGVHTYLEVYVSLDLYPRCIRF